MKNFLLLIVLLPFISSAQSISAGGGHSYAICDDSTAMAWGYNDDGALGHCCGFGSMVGLTGVKNISGGRNNTLILKNDGTVWATGLNNYGQCGNGSTTDIYIPEQITGLSNVSSISAGFYHSLALKSDGTVWAWGINGNGELGNGTNINSNIEKGTFIRPAIDISKQLSKWNNLQIGANYSSEKNKLNYIKSITSHTIPQ